jgi:GT2 family glycosyltransferase
VVEEVGNEQKDTGQQFSDDSYNAVHGCAMMVRCRLLDDVGLMDAAFCFYVEEVDWCLRFQEAGYRVKMVAESKVYHKEGVTIGGSKSPRALYYMARNRRLFLENRMRHQGKRLPLKKYLLPQLREYVDLLERGYYNAATAWLIGIGDALRRRYGRKDNLRWDAPFYRLFHKAVWLAVRGLRVVRRINAQTFQMPS